MDAKHITRDYSAHRKNVIRPVGEYTGLEIFSFDPKFTRIYIREDNSLKSGTNSRATGWRSWACYTASQGACKNCSNYKVNKKKQPYCTHYQKLIADITECHLADMTLSVDYNVAEEGEYRIDLVYEQNSSLYNGRDMTGGITISNGSETVHEDTRLLFDGENNCIKRIPLFLTLNKGNHTVKVDVPPNCYFYGIIIRKIVKYTCNNYYGADAGKDSGNMMFTDATLTISDMPKPSELSLTVLYDDAYECDYSPSGFYIDYMDEVNFYVKNNNGKVERVFGGYVSSILPNANRTQLSIHCADRLVDGQNKYILDKLKLQGGTGEEGDESAKDFDSYTQILKYVCDMHEVTLHSNISPNYLVEGEKFNKGFTITYGKDKTIKKIPTTNGYSSVSNNHVTIRNKPSGTKKQVWTLYDAKKHSKTAPNITDKPYMHITYGLGSPKTTHETKITSTVDSTDTTVGVQKFGKCGVSQDKKYVMAIGTTSSAKDNGHYGTYYKTVFENKCPHCGKATLRWDSCRSDTKCIYTGSWNGSKGSWGVAPIETEITCNSCDSDFSALGNEKDAPWKKLKVVTKTVKSSKKEQDKLHRGEMTAVPKTGVSATSDDIFKVITKEAFKYKYVLGATGQTYNQMKKTGHGDCWGFSDLIFTFFKKYNISSKIVEYDSGYASNHRSVLYKNKKGQWVDFPYREYGWGKKYNNNLNNTDGSKHGSVVQKFNGGNIGSATVTTKKTTKKETSKITTTKNYDKDKPFQGYLKITYSINSNSLKAPKHSLYIKFTQKYLKGESINEKGFPLYWVNNHTKKTTLVDKENKSLNIVQWLRQTHSKLDDSENYYLQSIQMIAPVKKATENNKDTDWYKYDKQTHDESSCKLDLYQISFDDDPRNLNADSLDSCGKTLNSMLQDIVKDTNYFVHMVYGLHRKDDEINFKVNNSSNISYTASEGNDNNILTWNSISYSPLSALYNMSICVFKEDENRQSNYYYVDSRVPQSIMEYGEQATLLTSNEPITKNEAYFNARMNPKFNAEQTYTFTITVPNYPSLHLGDYVKVLANAKKLNTVKEVKSLKISFSSNKMPRIQTEIGLDELAPDIQLKQNIRNMRASAKKETTDFSSSATPKSDDDGNLYLWDR